MYRVCLYALENLFACGRLILTLIVYTIYITYISYMTSEDVKYYVTYICILAVTSPYYL